MQTTPLPHQELILSHSKAPLYVVTAVFNPIRYSSRYNLYRDFAKYVKDSGATLITIECAFGNRPFEVTEPYNPHHIQVRTYEELWIKENLINIAISRLPSDWEYVAWVDADVMFTRHDWVAETIHLLQHYMVIQMFTDAYDLSPDYRIMDKHMGWAYSMFTQGIPNALEKPKSFPEAPYYYGEGSPTSSMFYHPGYAWAARKEAIDGLGGLMEFPILGAADHHMAWALIGEAHRTLPKSIHDNYRDLVYQWETNALETIHKDIGFMHGSVLHYWHGSKADRRYRDRWSILVDNGYNPLIDIKKDNQGVLALNRKNIPLRDGIREYFRVRNEDSIDLHPKAKEKLDK